MDPVSSAALGAAFGVALDELFKLTKKGCNILRKSSSKKFKATLQRLIPTIDENCAEGSESSGHCERQLRELQGNLRDALQLVEQCEQTGCLNLYKKFQYGRRLVNLQKDINNFMRTQALANLMLDVKKMDSNLKTLILQQMSTVDDAEPVNSSFPVPEMPKFVVGFGDFITALKERVFQSDVNVIGVEGTGGLGKTTLAKALCNDQEVKDFFQGNILFITVSQTPSLQGILETMWDQIIGKPKHPFQNVEDAHEKLQMQLRSITSRPTLVVLDDV